jgi:hypothetical protein
MPYDQLGARRAPRQTLPSIAYGAKEWVTIPTPSKGANNSSFHKMFYFVHRNFRSKRL